MSITLTAGELTAFKRMWLQEAYSRSDIARLLQLSRPTASVLVKKLIDGGYVSEDGCLRSSGGKPAIQLKVNADSFHSIGVDIGYDNVVRALRLNAAGEISASAEIAASSGYSERLDAAVRAIDILRTPVTCGVGVAVSGIVDPRSGNIIRSANFELTGKPLVSDIQSASGLPVYIDNRARMAARAEMFSGAARGIDDFLLVSLGKGIGSAFSFSGRLHFGVSGKAGELRDIIVPDHYSGCGVTTLEKALSEDTLEQQDYPCRIMADICASGFRQVLNVTAQEVLILAGRFSMFPKSFHDELRRKMPDIDLRLSQFGRDSGACGGAVAAAENTIFSQL